MSEYAGRPNLPGYVSIKEAARILGISDKRVYTYVSDGRLSSMWAADVIMIPEQEVLAFKRQSSGRPRKSVPVWRISAGENIQFKTSIHVRIRRGQQEVFGQKLEEMRCANQHIFPGTVTRFIVESDSEPDWIEILLFWKAAIAPQQAEREEALAAFRQEFRQILDWETAQYDTGKVLLHT
jgi:hypothetical protein